jgi:cutinase
MAFSCILAVFLSLAAFSYAHPVSSGLNVAQSQLAELFQVGVESHLRSIPSEDIQELSQIVNTPSAAQACEDVYLIFARGTFEPSISSNLGMVVGMPFSAALTLALGRKFGSIGVDYNNGVMGYLTGGDSAGSTTMAKMIDAKASQCPSTKIIASGYR